MIQAECLQRSRGYHATALSSFAWLWFKEITLSCPGREIISTSAARMTTRPTDCSCVTDWNQQILNVWSYVKPGRTSGCSQRQDPSRCCHRTSGTSHFGDGWTFDSCTWQIFDEVYGFYHHMVESSQYQSVACHLSSISLGGTQLRRQWKGSWPELQMWAAERGDLTLLGVGWNI